MRVGFRTHQRGRKHHALKRWRGGGNARAGNAYCGAPESLMAGRLYRQWLSYRYWL